MEKYLVKHNPSFESLQEFISNYQNTHMLIIFVSCKVFYTGRAKSTLSWGDHLIIRKKDGTLLIHGSNKREPINWQPPGSSLKSKCRRNLILISRRRHPKEEIKIVISKIYFAVAVDCREGKFQILGTENQMVQQVIAKPYLLEEGFTPLKREFQTPYGNIDLLGKDKKGTFVIVEFKRGKAQLSAVSQLKRYVEYLQKKHPVRGILVAPGITKSAEELIKKVGLEFKKWLSKAS